jgi:hypothetical protein
MPFCALLAAIAEVIVPEQNGGDVRSARCCASYAA